MFDEDVTRNYHQVLPYVRTEVVCNR